MASRFCASKRKHEYRVAHKKTSPNFCFKRGIFVPPLQNCFGNWLDHCLSLIHKKQKLSRICWRTPYYLNVVDFIPADEASQLLLMTGRRILQISFLGITVSLFEISCRNSCRKTDNFRSQIYVTLKRLSVTNKWKWTPPRQFENPLHNGKEDWIKLKSRMMTRFSTFSPVSVTAERFHEFNFDALD